MNRTPRVFRTRAAGFWLLLVLATSSPSVARAGQGVWTSNGPQGSGSVYALVASPTSSSVVYAGTSRGVFRTTDSGATWVATGAGPGGINALAVDPTTPSTLYAGSNSGVYRSTDSGGTWTFAGSGLGRTYVSALAINPATPSTLYAAMMDEIYKSTNAGGTWAILAPTQGYYVYYSGLAIDPASPSTLYAARGGDRPVIKSTDSGVSWNGASAGIPSIYSSSLVIDPVRPSTLYAGTWGGGIFKSVDAGTSWTASNLGLTNLKVTALTINPANPSALYAGTEGGGVFWSADAGGSWTTLNVGLPDLRILSLAVDPRGGNLYAGLPNGVWQLSSPPAGSFLIPSSAHSPGAHGAFYTTNVSVSNTGSGPASFTMKFLGNNQDGSNGPERTFDLDAGRSVTFFDVLNSVFDAGTAYGAIRVTSSTSSLAVVSVTSTAGLGGTLSQTIPAVFSSGLIGTDSPRSILYLREGDGFRTNLILASNAGVSTTVDAVLVSPEGATLATKSYSLPPNGMTHIDRVVRDMEVSGPVTGARLVVTTSSPGAAFAALATVIDEATNDATAVEAR